MVKVSINNVSGDFKKGSKLEDIINVLHIVKEYKALAALNGGTCIELDEPVEKDMSLRLVTYNTEEGVRLYERSLRLLTLCALRKLYPTKQSEVRDSVGHAIVFVLKDFPLTHAEIETLEAEMHRLVKADLPINKTIWSTEEAIKYFEQDGQKDKVELLKYRKYKTITMYGLDGHYDYFYGGMLPSTSYIDKFSLACHYPGILVRYPSSPDMKTVEAYKMHGKQFKVFDDSLNWCKMQNASTIPDINKLIETGKIHEFIRINEALHETSIAGIANQVIDSKSKIVLIFGPSCSGKTTFTHRLNIHLAVHGIDPKVISLDNFYKNRADIPLNEYGEPDFETINALDIPKLVSFFDKLLSGEEVHMPVFDFAKGVSTQGELIKIGPEQLLLVEGIHAMNDKVTSQLPDQMCFGIYVSSMTCLSLDRHNRIRTSDARLLRRIVRDKQFRNSTPKETIEMWPNVRNGEEKWIYPNQEKADIMFNTTLHYELPLLRSYIYDDLDRIDPSLASYLPARRIVKSLNYCLPINQDTIKEIPPLSIIREFIGGCTLYMDHTKNN